MLTASTRSPGRLTELDAMRGIAAFSVVLSHAADDLRTRGGVLPDILTLLDATPPRALFNGRDAVIFFFVLSGMVLTRGLVAGSSPGFLIFAMRRAVRLCVPAAAAVVLSALLFQLFYHPDIVGGPGDWLASAGWTRVPSLTDTARHALLFGADGDFPLDAVLWSLVHELRLSVLLPLLVVASIRWDPRGGTLPLMAGALLLGLEIGGHGIGDVRFSGQPGVAMLLSLAYLALPAALFLWVALRLSLFRVLGPAAAGTPFQRRRFLAGCCLGGSCLGLSIGQHGGVMLGASLPDSFLATLYFAPCFALGAALSMGVLANFAPAPEQRLPCLAGGLLLLSYDNLFAVAAASFLLILVARQPGRFQSLLRLPPFVFLGRVSFSLYLVHVPLLLAARHALDGVLPHGTILLLWVVLSIPAAWAMYRIAEEPARRLAGRIGRLPQAAGTRIPSVSA